MNINNDESDEIQRSANSQIVKELKFDQKYVRFGQKPIRTIGQSAMTIFVFLENILFFLRE